MQASESYLTLNCEIRVDLFFFSREIARERRGQLPGCDFEKLFATGVHVYP